MLRLRTVEHVVILGAAAIVGACASAAQLPVSAGIGADPRLPAPKTSAIPLVKVATARAHGRPVALPSTRAEPCSLRMMWEIRCGGWN